MSTLRFTLSLALLFVLILAPCLEAQTVPDRSAPPQLGPPPKLHLPPIRHLKLANGLPVLLLEKHQVPLVQVDLLVMAGAVDDPPGKSGLASMTAAMLTEGAGKRNALELADAVDFLGATLTAESGYHTSTVELHTPLAKLDSALDLLADVARRPRFAAEELERVRSKLLTDLLQWRDQPPTLASIAFSRVLYGDHHPYGAPRSGSEASIRSFARNDLVAFQSRYFCPNNCTLIVVGDVTAQAVLPRLERGFGSWKPSRISRETQPRAEQVAATRIVLVDKPGAAQSEIRIGRIGAKRETEDYFPVVVMNTLLGGSFASRLNENLREAHGYTYGAGSRFDFRIMPGPFVAGAAVQTDVTDKALAEFLKELRNIAEPVGAAELERARNFVALSFPRDFESVEAIATELQQLVAFRLRDDYFDTYVDHILAVTSGDVQRAARKYIDPSKLDIVIVGDRAKIEQGVEALHLGPMTFMSVDEVLGTGQPPKLQK